MKSFQAVILAAILAAASADNEPVASPTFFKQELANYEHQLRNFERNLSLDKGTDETSPPQDPPSRPNPPTPGVSSPSCSISFATSLLLPHPAALVCTDSLPWPRRQFFLTVILTIFSLSLLSRPFLSLSATPPYL